MDGDSDEMWEFKMMFSDLQGKTEQLVSAVSDSGVEENYDDCITGLLGTRYKMVGWDGYEEDYYSLTGFESGLATKEAGKRLMRKTKQEIISTIGQCLGTLLVFLDIRQTYDYLKATMDILRDENHSILQTVKRIEALYDAAEQDGFRWLSDNTRLLDAMVRELPDRLWVES